MVKKVKSQQINYYKDFVIIAEEGVEKGIFLRCPIKYTYFEVYNDAKYSAQKYFYKIKRNPFRRLFEIIIGNKKVLKCIKDWDVCMDLGGFYANVLCSPVHFKRNYKKTTASRMSENTDNNINLITVYGYDNNLDRDSLSCSKEKLEILFDNGETINSVHKSNYHFTYIHNIQNIIDSNRNKEVV